VIGGVLPSANADITAAAARGGAKCRIGDFGARLAFGCYCLLARLGFCEELGAILIGGLPLLRSGYAADVCHSDVAASALSARPLRICFGALTT